MPIKSQHNAFTLISAAAILAIFIGVTLCIFGASRNSHELVGSGFLLCWTSPLVLLRLNYVVRLQQKHWIWTFAFAFVVHLITKSTFEREKIHDVSAIDLSSRKTESQRARHSHQTIEPLTLQDALNYCRSSLKLSYRLVPHKNWDLPSPTRKHYAILLDSDPSPSELVDFITIFYHCTKIDHALQSVNFDSISIEVYDDSSWVEIAPGEWIGWIYEDEGGAALTTQWPDMHSHPPSERELQIYRAAAKVAFADQDTDINTLFKPVARRFKISLEQTHNIFGKVFDYRHGGYRRVAIDPPTVDVKH